MSGAAPPAVEIRPATTGRELEEVRSLLRAYNRHLSTILDPALLQRRATELEQLPGAFAPPRGALLLATIADRPVGCVGLRPLPAATIATPPTAAECCRLWVSAEARGHSLGRRLVQAVIAIARENGYHDLYLNCVPETMPAGFHLYTGLGFTPVAPYKPVAIPGIRYLRLPLDPAAAAALTRPADPR